MEDHTTPLSQVKYVTAASSYYIYVTVQLSTDAQMIRLRNLSVTSCTQIKQFFFIIGLQYLDWDPEPTHISVHLPTLWTLCYWV